MNLPAAVSATLVRGIAAYLRDAPPTEVPPDLRRFAGFRDQALKPHRAKLLGALESEEFRNHVLDWLDDSPPLKREEIDLLSVAAAREDGWEDALSSAAPAKKSPVKSEAQRLQEELERERKKVTKLKEELRVQRDSAREEVRLLKLRLTEAGGESRDLKAKLRAAEAEVRGARSEVDRLERAGEKEKRSLRRDAERAAAARAAADEKMSTLKREVAALKRQIQGLEGDLETERKKSASATRSGRASASRGDRKRRKLPAPKGLLGDARETLEAWLGADGVRMIVDGYNVGKAPAGFPEMDLGSMRKRVVDEVVKLTRRYSFPAVVVFDGADVAPGTARRRQGDVKIEYSSADEIADDHIVALVESLPPDPVIVVTNDRDLQERVARLEATVATSDQLLSLLR